MIDLTPEGKIVYLIRQSGSAGKRFRVLRREMNGEFSERHIHRLIEKLIDSGKIVKSSRDEDGFSRYYVTTTDVNVTTTDVNVTTADVNVTTMRAGACSNGRVVLLFAILLRFTILCRFAIL
jgi:hypothetical protein